MEDDAMEDDLLVEAFLDRLIRDKNTNADQQKLIARGAIFSGIAEAIMFDPSKTREVEDGFSGYDRQSAQLGPGTGVARVQDRFA